MPRFGRFLKILMALAATTLTHAATTNKLVTLPGFKISLWAKEPMLRSPVSISFDDQGRLYVVETARRGSVDIDIRAHQEWLVGDLANQSVDDLRRFFRSRMSPERSLENAGWLRDLNGDGVHDWRDLIPVKERVHLLADTTGSGHADQSSVFAEGFNEEISGVAAGVLPWGKDVFVTAYPDLWRLRDVDGDGVADTYESLFRGFGVHAGFDGHDLHGLTVGPDGRIYFSIGDNGFSVVNKEGLRLHYPNTGGVLRMNPDGSNLEVFATGLRNVQELAFDEFGNLFSVDNDGDLEDERERFVYITEGSDSGWRINWQFRDPGWSKFSHQPNYNPWIADRMWVPHFPGQPAHITPPLTNYSVGPSGFKYNPGTALNTRYQRHFFLCQYPVQKLTTFQTRPKGAYFEMINEETFLGGMMATTLNFSPDGAMYVADWDGMWNPSGRGGIWVLDDPAAAGNPLRLQVKSLLAEGMEKRPAGELARLLDHPDQRIRQRAQFELARRRDIKLLLEIALRPSAPQLARVHSLWGLSQIGRPLTPAQLPFSDPDLEIRAQAAKAAGELKLQPAIPELIRLLSDSAPRVRFHAAIALGKISAPSAIPALARLLEENADRDAFIRHAGVMGLAGSGAANQVAALAGSPSPAVRLAAVVALRRAKSPSVGAFISDSDASVRVEAVRAIHDDFSIPAALPEVAALLENLRPTDGEAIVRRALNANLRLGTEESARRLLRYATSKSHSEALRVEALLALGDWDRTPFLDRVEGMIRFDRIHVPGIGNQLLEHNLAEILSDAPKLLAETVTQLIIRNQLAADPSVFAAWVADASQLASVRSQALLLLGQRHASQLAGALDLAVNSTSEELHLAALRVLAESDPSRFVSWASALLKGGSLRERQSLIRLAAPLSNASALLASAWDSLQSGQISDTLKLDLVEALRSSPDATLRAKYLAYEQALPVGDKLARFRPALSGGDPVVGRELFRNHVSAQCVRCHEAGGDGHQAGPVLAGLASRSTSEYILESLIDPSARIAPGFETVSLELKNGDTLDGTLLKDSGSELRLRLTTGEIRDISAPSVAKRSASTVSAMPPMGDVLKPLELRDIVAYLMSLK
jgi:quinoprotein glucose dehydrogenase